MNNMTIEEFLHDNGACHDGRVYAEQFKTMYEVYNSLLSGKAGYRSFEWAWWAVVVGALTDDDALKVRQGMTAWFFEVLRPHVGDEVVEEAIQGGHTCQHWDNLWKQMLQEKKILGGFSYYHMAMRRAMESLDSGGRCNYYSQGVRCLQALAMLKAAGDPENPATFNNRDDASPTDNNRRTLRYPGESAPRTVELITPEVMGQFLAKLKELGNPFQAPKKTRSKKIKETQHGEGQ